MSPRPLVAPPPPAGGVDVDVPGDGVRLRATRWPGEGPAVLLLHGLASTRHVWRLVAPHLAGLAVVALDQRGHGDSERPAGPYDGATVARDVLTALDALGLSRVVVVGHSWGASTALRLAATAPGRVLACVGVDGGLGALRSAGATREQARENLTPPRLALPPDRVRDAVAGAAPPSWWSSEVEEAVLPLFEVGDDGLVRARLPFDAHMAVLDDLLDTDHDALMRATACPTWLVSCEPPAGGDATDRALVGAKQQALDRAAGLLDRPRLLTWRGAVHDVPVQWPALVAGLVRAARDEVALRRRVPSAATGEGHMS